MYFVSDEWREIGFSECYFGAIRGSPVSLTPSAPMRVADSAAVWPAEELQPALPQSQQGAPAGRGGNDIPGAASPMATGGA